MDKINLKTIRKIATEHLYPIRQIQQHLGELKWIKFMREVLGMSQTQMAKKMSVSQAAIKKAEDREKERTITLKNLDQYAEALGCKVVYFFVPIESIESVIEKQARKRALEMTKKTNRHMELENQSLSKEQIQDQIENLVEELKYSKELWDD